MAQAAEKILSTLAPHLRTVGVALRGAGASLMAYAPPAAADVGAQLEANGARPSVAAGAFVAPTATLIGDVAVGAAGAALSSSRSNFSIAAWSWSLALRDPQELCPTPSTIEYVALHETTASRAARPVGTSWPRQPLLSRYSSLEPE